MTMDPALKVAMALCVLLGGVCAALQFRRDASRPGLHGRGAAQQLRIRSRQAPAQVVPASSGHRTLPTEPPATVVKPLDGRASPAPLAAKHPEADRPASSPWQPSTDAMLPLRETARTHRIIDGDTLEGLAQRYLGSANRASELLNANRDVLADPNLLPIGAELRIPLTDAGQSRP
jgi:nucleoid-associated protein YgaU